MPILALNQFGEIYETSPDREDGTGYGRSPHVVDQRDLTLGAAYLKAQNDRQQEQMRNYQARVAEDIIEQSRRQMWQRQMGEMRRLEAHEARTLNHPAIQKELFKKATMQGCKCEHKTPTGANGLSANGMFGWHGMSRDQQTIHHVMSGMGANTAYALDPEEAHQAQMREHANNALRRKAR